MTITALKRVVIIKGVSIHISTSPSPYLGDVGCHNHPLLGLSVPAGYPYGISPFLASQRAPASDLHGLVHVPPILGYAMALIPFVTPHLNDTQYCSLLTLPNQTFQEVTYPSTTLAKARLTAEF
jgi:hypothetical protein